MERREFRRVPYYNSVSTNLGEKILSPRQASGVVMDTMKAHV
jgi:hypothetical protein